MRSFLVSVTIFHLCSFFPQKIYAQDKIVKLNGDTILAKVLEIGANAVSYRKSGGDAATYVENKSEIKFIRYATGTIEDFGRSSTDQEKAAAAVGSNTSASNGKNKIEMLPNGFLMNGQGLSRKEVNKELANSKNPAIPLLLKTTKATKTAQLIVKITAFPTTIGGGCATLVTGINMFNDIRRGRDHTKTYVSAFGCLLTTVSLPITNSILKKKSDKMYKKLIDMYNLTN
jgi:hypothetical protein